MCGIVGALANRPAAPLILAALRRLEYRGYDSAGIATLDGGRIARRRAAGKLDALARLLEASPLSGTSGVGHTRWATHGAPTEANAHPHVALPVAVVHNGIIENAAALRAQLQAEGRAFESETDTEVIAHLTARAMAAGAPPLDAVAQTLPLLRGAFALCFLFEGAEDLLVCARRGSPLAIGYGEGEMFVGSDALALAPLTGRGAYLEEGDYAALTRGGAHIFAADGSPVQRPIRTLALETALVDKAGKRHFMAKEIDEQPMVAARALDLGAAAARAAQIDWAALRRVTMVACGTAYYACCVAKYWFEQVARLSADADIASEFRYRDPVLEPGGMCVFVSQSGETADTLAALRLARAAGQVTVAVVNVEESSIAREADVVIPIHAGPEIGVASTKAFTCQLAVLAAFAANLARAKGRIDAAEEAEIVKHLAEAPEAMSRALDHDDDIAAMAGLVSPARDVLYLGRGPDYPMALEGALKLKEISYIHAEGYAAGEMKHGPIALIDEDVPVIVIAPSGELFEKTVSNMHEVAARGGQVILISDAAGIAAAGDGCVATIEMPACHPLIQPLVYAVPVQLLAYHVAVAKGTDVDQPRNLAKSVTVE